MDENCKLTKQDLKKAYADFFNVKYPGWNGYYLVDTDYSLSTRKGKNVIDMVFYRFGHIVLADVVLGYGQDLDRPAFLENILAQHFSGYYNNESNMDVLVDDISRTLKAKVEEGSIKESPEYELLYDLDNLEINPSETESLVIFAGINRKDLRLIKELRQIEKYREEWSDILKKTKFLISFDDEPNFVYEALEDEHQIPFERLCLRIKHILMQEDSIHNSTEFSQYYKTEVK